ncbi:MAG: transcription termination/antitermination protein NusA, partial [Alphaproteobacteria bacterium]|nr:transcription termination/antitermination protein NusA [Alphaproteobacteria bacterium]
VRLASQLTEWDIDILTEVEESDRRQEEFRQRTELFVSVLDVDELLAQLIVTEGFSTVEEVAFVPPEELASIEGFELEIAEELGNRARAFLEAEATRLDGQRKELGVTDELAAIEGLTPAILVILGENGVKVLDDLADLASDELLDFIPNAGMTVAAANEVIMAARAHWFEGEDGEATADGEETVAGEPAADEEKDAGEAEGA